MEANIHLHLKMAIEPFAMTADEQREYYYSSNRLPPYDMVVFAIGQKNFFETHLAKANADRRLGEIYEDFQRLLARLPAEPHEMWDLAGREHQNWDSVRITAQRLLRRLERI
ncbi:hypothetical protein [Altererythrobacter lutimaris]|uniref:Uncharacterized protein n=1 Tax=Altererythrobacter lutimaris TaxID=2743979 RepID=A0A850H731_9SPHN|nr:hypothetical protein [Altererythrobacter lutimaris]NVE93569.1 hypothetical protein [Altererythrobacter lutimaris]